jgi:hypothetical protein
MKCLFVLTFSYISILTMFLFICFNRLYIYSVSMDHFCNSYTDTDLTSLYSVIFIEPLAILPMEALSFDSEQFRNKSIKKVIEGKRNYSFELLEEHFFAYVVHKNMKCNLKTCRMK